MIDMKNKAPTTATRDFAITLLHIIGMVMILICHMLQEEKIYFLSEIFISGVPLFLFISGYLTGMKKISNPRAWLLKKAKRIYIPFVVLAVIVYVTFSLTALYPVSLKQWLVTLFNFQGFNYTYWKFDPFNFHIVHGCGHWWFVTSLAFCYLLAPLMQKLKNISVARPWRPLLIIGILAVQLGLLLVGFQPFYIFTFFGGYFLSGKVRTDGKWYAFVSVMMVLSMPLRLLARKYIDGSIIYDRYVALVCEAVLAVWIFYTVYFLKEKLPGLFKALDCKAIHFTDGISYYFYLTHYLFLDGPVALFNFIENRIVAHLAIVVCSYTAAVLLYLLVEKGLFKLMACAQNPRIKSQHKKQETLQR